MKHLNAALAILLISVNGYSQEKNIDTINVVLLGTFHYGTTTDASRTDFPDLFSPKRQRELEELTTKLAELNIDKLFIERQEKYQHTYDSLYRHYLSKKITDTVVLRPEEIQLGFRLAQKSGLEKVYCVDVKQDLPYNQIKAFETTYDGKEDAPFFSKSTYPFNDESEELDLPHQTLTEYYLKMNNDYHKKYRLYDYLHYAMSYVEQDDYTGPEFTGIWYDRNLKIFSNILNNLTPEDKTIFVLFGASHTDVLEQFFRSNPHFRILEVQQVLAE